MNLHSSIMVVVVWPALACLNCNWKKNWNCNWKTWGINLHMRVIQHLTAQAGPGEKKKKKKKHLWWSGYWLTVARSAGLLFGFQLWCTGFALLGPFILTQSQIFSFVALPCGQKYLIIIQTNSNQGVYCV